MEAMKKVVAIGSAIACNVAHQLPAAKYSVSKQYMSVNPLSIIKESSCNFSDLKTVNKEAYIEDINKTIFTEIKEIEPDLVILDLLDCRLTVNEYRAGEKVFFATENNGLSQVIRDIGGALVNSINPFDLTESEWLNGLTCFVEKIIEACNNKPIIVLDTRCATTYLSKTGKLYNLYALDYAAQINKFFDKIYTLIRLAAPQFKYIPGFDIYYCDEKVRGRAFSFSLQKEYYEYAVKAIDLLFNNCKDADLLKLRNEYNLIGYNRYRAADPREKRWKPITLDSFCGVYADDFGNYVDTCGNKITIVFNGYNNQIFVKKECLIDSLKIVLGQDNIVNLSGTTRIAGNTIFSIGNKNNVEIVGSDINYLNLILKNNNSIKISNNCKFAQSNSISLANNNSITFSGDSEINGVFINGYDNNRILFGDATILGNNVRFNLESNVSIDIGAHNMFKINLNFLMFVNSRLSIGNNNKFFSNNREFRCHSYTETIIKNDTLWSLEISVLNGDGHSIFNIENNEKLNDLKHAESSKRTIFIGNHVWVGKRAMIMNGAHISDGCIIGANTFVKKKYPNNCCIAGNPGKVVRKNVVWCTNNDAETISSCPAQYINLTSDNVDR